MSIRSRIPLMLLVSLSGEAFANEAVPEIDVHFVVLTDAKATRRFTTRAAMDEALKTINDRMVTEAGAPLVRLKYASVTSFEEASASRCQIAQAAEAGKKWFAPYSKCDDPKLRHPSALNFLIYKQASGPTRSFGGTVKGKPFLAVEYRFMSADRLLTHETGHAFGLRHVCPNGPVSNILNSKAGCKALPNGEGGKHFTPSQVSIVRERAKKAQALFKARKDADEPAETTEE